MRVFTAADVPGSRATGLNSPDQPVFVAEGEVTCCVADFLAMVVADTQFHARQAASGVRVEYEVLEPVTDPIEALKPGAPEVHSADTFHPAPNLLQPITAFARGDVDAALETAAHVIEATFVTTAVEPAFLEPEACLAVPQGKGVKVHAESQGSIHDQQQIARVLNLEPDAVEIALAASGGAFGAKEELSIQAQTAVAAHLLGRPVKTVLTREQSTQHHVKRHPMTITLTVGADAEGRLLAVRSRIMADAGGYHTTSAKCALRAACHACGPYRVPNVDVESKAVHTNNPSSGAMRGFGSNQAQFAMEGAMDILAEKVGVDGWDIRMRNVLNPGDSPRHRARSSRERPGDDGVARGREGGLQEREIQGHRLRHQEHRAWQRDYRGWLHHHPCRRRAKAGDSQRLHRDGQGIFTATLQAVCEETGLPADIMEVIWDKDLGNKCGETAARR